MEDNFINELNEIKEKVNKATIILVALLPISLIFLIAIIMMIQDIQETGNNFGISNQNFLVIYFISLIIYIFKFVKFSRKLNQIIKQNDNRDDFINIYKSLSKTNLFHLAFYVIGLGLISITIITFIF